jgi:hypothetical protein
MHDIHCVYIPHFLYSSVNEQLDCCNENGCAGDLAPKSFEYILRIEIAGSYDNSIFYFLGTAILFSLVTV